MKSRRKYRMVLLLITTLVLSPLLGVSGAYAVMQDSLVQNLSVTSQCHKTSAGKACKHCETMNNTQCQHGFNDNCDSRCGHSVVTAAITNQSFDFPLYVQDHPKLYKKPTMSIVLDTDLRPPQVI